MLTADEACELALGLPETTEQDHHGRPSFRVRDTIFATLWSPTELNVMLGDELILAAVETDPGTCSPCYWGKRLAAVRVDLSVADPALVRDLLQAAWASHGVPRPSRRARAPRPRPSSC
jgi:hypothetical protein